MKRWVRTSAYVWLVARNQHRLSNVPADAASHVTRNPPTEAMPVPPPNMLMYVKPLNIKSLVIKGFILSVGLYRLSL